MHAVIVMAYKDFDALWALVASLDRTAYKLFVHINRKTTITPEQIAALRSSGCFVLQKRRIAWGSFTHLLAVLDLLEIALEDRAIEYVHVISGQDFPASRFDDVKRACSGQLYMSVTAAPNMPQEVKDRYERYNLFNFVQTLEPVYRVLTRWSLRLQRLLRAKRTRLGDFDELFKGMVWVSLPAEVGRFVLNSPRKKKFMRALRTTFIPEEFFFQTMLMNSEFRDSVVANNMRYTDWSHRNGSCPAILDLSDFDKIVASKPFFVRKVDSRVSRELVARLTALLA